MSTKDFCDCCKKEYIKNTDRYLEVVAEASERKRTLLIWLTAYDTHRFVIDICETCRDKLFGLVKPIVMEKLNEKSS